LHNELTLNARIVGNPEAFPRLPFRDSLRLAAMLVFEAADRIEATLIRIASEWPVIRPESMANAEITSYKPTSGVAPLSRQCGDSNAAND